MSTNVSKNQVVCPRCHFAGLASGMLCTRQASASSRLQRPAVNERTARYHSSSISRLSAALLATASPLMVIQYAQGGSCSTLPPFAFLGHAYPPPPHPS